MMRTRRGGAGGLDRLLDQVERNGLVGQHSHGSAALHLGVEGLCAATHLLNRIALELERNERMALGQLGGWVGVFVLRHVLSLASLRSGMVKKRLGMVPRP